MNNYFICNLFDSRNYNYILVQDYEISPPSMKQKIVNITGMDGTLNFNDKNDKNRPLYDDRIVTIPLILHSNTPEEHNRHINEFLNTFGALNGFELKLSKSGDLIWNAYVEKIQPLKRLGNCADSVVLQFRISPFCLGNARFSDTFTINSETITANIINNGSFYCDTYELHATGSFETLRISSGDNFLEYRGGLAAEEKLIIDFKNYTIKKEVEGVLTDVNTNTWSGFFFELQPGDVELTLYSNGNANIYFVIWPKYLYAEVL